MSTDTASCYIWGLPDICRDCKHAEHQSWRTAALSDLCDPGQVNANALRESLRDDE
jgi:hypothetical protein